VALALTSGSASASASGSVPGLGHFDLAYLDPPYNQHRYFTNYHVWETLVAWDAPEAYGVARKRLDARDPSTHSVFNSKKTMAAALASVVQSVDCDLLVLSYNNESWLGLEDLEAMCCIQNTGIEPGATTGADTDAKTAAAKTRELATLAFDSARYIGARIGIFDPSGRKVGRVGHLSNQELIVIAGESALVRHVVEAAEGGATGAAPGTAPAAASVAPSGPVAVGLADRLQQAT
jgi:adenine-specific DNA-methyltransferase